MDYFRVEGVKKSYDDFDLEASLSCRQGEQLAILGPSGSGKTTLLRIIAGLIPPDSGSIQVMGRELAGLPARKRGIGLVFQDFALFPHLDVGDNIAYGLKVRGMGSRESRKKVDDLLERFSLPGFARRRVAELSGGERQRVALARSLAVEPSLMLFDEPLASLDAELRRELRDELRHLQRELGFTSVLVTHDQEDALSSADRVAVMHQGRVVRCGTPEEVYRNPGSIWTAGFVGNGNLLPNQPGYAWHDPALPGTAMFLARPEELVLRESTWAAEGEHEAGPAWLVVTVVVGESVFQGRSWLARARVTPDPSRGSKGDLPVIVTFYADSEPVVGAPYRLGIARSALAVIKE